MTSMPTQPNNPIGNPAQQEAMAILRQYGGDGQKAFYAECQRRGIDPNYALKQAQIMFNQMYGGNGR